MPDLRMTGPRKWRFTSGVAVQMDDCDFWVDYQAEARDDGRVLLGVVLRAAWEHVDFAQPAGHARRFYLEERLRALAHEFTGKKGTLEIDYGTSYAKTFAAITFKNVIPELASANEILRYDLTLLRTKP